MARIRVGDLKDLGSNPRSCKIPILFFHTGSYATLALKDYHAPSPFRHPRVHPIQINGQDSEEHVHQGQRVSIRSGKVSKRQSLLGQHPWAHTSNSETIPPGLLLLFFIVRLFIYVLLFVLIN